MKSPAALIFARPRPLRLGASDEAILRAVGAYHYLTAQQVCRLLYAPGSLTTVQTRLKRLAEAGYLLRLVRRNASRVGSAPLVYTLAGGGRRFLRRLGCDLSTRFRPKEDHELGDAFLEHTLCVNDVLIAAALLCRGVPRVCLEEVWHELVLKTRPFRLGLPDGTTKALIPDGWLDFRVGADGAVDQVAVVLELERTNEQRAWRRKVAAYAAFAAGPYQQAFATNSLTIAVVAAPATGVRERRDALLRWTEAELRAQGRQDLAHLFLIGGEDAAVADPVTFFGAPAWRQPFAASPVALIEPGEEAGAG